LVNANFYDILNQDLSHCIYRNIIDYLRIFNQVFIFGSFIASLFNVTNKGMAISTGKFGTLIGFDTCQDGEVK
jgi:hypothetical protein